jgi:hypothetical protein
MTKRDGFIVYNIETDEEVHFVECQKNGPSRDQVYVGMLMRLREDINKYVVADTREMETE